MGRCFAVQEDRRDEFIEDYEALQSLRKLSEKWGISFETARKTAIRFGVVSPQGARRRGDYHPMLGVWSDGRVARDLGVSRQAVAKARARRGLESKVGQALREVSALERD